MKETKNLKQFISHMAEKNYSEANKSLQQIIEDKLKERVKASLAEPKTGAKK
jgi:hypothetical protein